MALSKAVFETDVPSRYINRLCRHWSHKFEVAFDDAQGVIKLGESVCTLKAGDNALHVSIEAADQNLDELEHVVFAHLERFAPQGAAFSGSWVRVQD